MGNIEKIQTGLTRTGGVEITISGTLYSRREPGDVREQTCFKGDFSRSGVGSLVLYPDAMDRIGADGQATELEYEITVRKKQ